MNIHERSGSQEATTDGISPGQLTTHYPGVPELEELTVQLEKARALEAEFRAFADSVRDYAFITLGLDGNVIGWNKGAELLLGYSPEEMLGRPGALLFTPDDDPVRHFPRPSTHRKRRIDQCCTRPAD
jgi:PAS domain-containing protein